MNAIASLRHRNYRLLRLGIVAVIYAFFITGCVQTQVIKGSDAITGPINSARVLVMDPDVELSILTAAGLNEPNAQWSAQGLENVKSALAGEFKERNIKLIPYQSPDNNSAQHHNHTQLLKLHQAVGVTILRHKYTPALELPTKQQRFDWNLGPYTKELRDQFDADYAMFVFMRDSYASSGRVATIILMAALGVGIQGGIQVGFASIVDLNNGNIVWFNRLIDTTGDLRDPQGTVKAVKSLLSEVPL